MTTYSIKIVNNSSMANTFSLFQNGQAGAGPSDPLSLAWFAGPIGLIAARPVTFGPQIGINPVETVSQPAIQPISDISPNEFSVGIGMSGAGTFFVRAEPNITLTSTRHPAYWVTSGTYETGEPIDVKQHINGTDSERSGSGASHSFVPAQPNMRITFAPHPNYWVIFGNLETSEPINIEQVNGTDSDWSRSVTTDPVVIHLNQMNKLP